MTAGVVILGSESGRVELGTDVITDSASSPVTSPPGGEAFAVLVALALRDHDEPMPYLLHTCLVSELWKPRPDPRVVAWLGEMSEDDRRTVMN
jgi:hypothetical protein